MLPVLRVCLPHAAERNCSASLFVVRGGLSHLSSTLYSVEFAENGAPFVRGPRVFFVLCGPGCWLVEARGDHVYTIVNS